MTEEKNTCPDCGKACSSDLIHTCSPQLKKQTVVEREVRALIAREYRNKLSPQDYAELALRRGLELAAERLEKEVFDRNERRESWDTNVNSQQEWDAALIRQILDE